MRLIRLASLRVVKWFEKLRVSAVATGRERGGKADQKGRVRIRFGEEGG